MATQRLTRIIQLQVQAEQYNREMKKIAQSTQKVEKQLGGIRAGMQKLNRIGNLAVGGIAALGSVRLATGLIKTTDSIILMESAFGQLLKSGERGADMMERVYDIAEVTGAPLVSVGKSVQQLSVGLSAMGASNEEIAAIAENFLKLGRIGGKQIEDVNGALYQFSQALASNRLQGDEFRAILERVPLVAQKIADYLEVDIGALKDLAQQGIITADVMRKSMTSASDDIDKSFSALPAIWEQGVARIQTAFLELAVEMATTTEVTTTLAEAMSNFAKAVRGAADDVGDLIRGLREVSDIVSGIALVGLGAWAGRLLGLAAAAGKLAKYALSAKGALDALRKIAGKLRFAGLIGALITVLTNMDRVKEAAEGLAAAMHGIAPDDLPRRYEALRKMGMELERLEKRVNAGPDNPHFTKEQQDEWMANAIAERDQARLLYESEKRSIEAMRGLLDATGGGSEAAAATEKAFKWLSEAGGGDRLPAIAHDFAEGWQKTAAALWDAAEPVRVLRRELVDIDLSTLYGLPDAIAEELKSSKIKEFIAEQFQIDFALAPNWERDLRDALTKFDNLTEIFLKLGMTQEEIDRARQLVEEKYILEPIEVTATIKMDDVEIPTEEITTWQQNMLDAVKGFRTDFVNTIVDGIAEGKMAFDDLLQHVLKVLARMALDAALAPVFDAITGAIQTNTLAATPVLAGGPALLAGPGIGQTMNVGVLSTPTYGYDASSGRTGQYNVNVNNYGNDEVRVEQNRNQQGGIDLDIFIEQKMAQAIAGGGLDAVAQASWGARRRGY